MPEHTVPTSPANADPSTPATGPRDLPDAAAFWRWAGQASRPVVGWVLIGAGSLALLLGYLGVSREAIVAKQMPFLISGGVAGVVLVALGAFFLGTEDLRGQLRRLDRLEAMIEDLHGVLLERDDAEIASAQPTPAGADADTGSGASTAASGSNGASATPRRRTRATRTRAAAKK